MGFKKLFERSHWIHRPHLWERSTRDQGAVWGSKAALSPSSAHKKMEIWTWTNPKQLSESNFADEDHMKASVTVNALIAQTFKHWISVDSQYLALQSITSHARCKFVMLLSHFMRVCLSVRMSVCLSVCLCVRVCVRVCSWFSGLTCEFMQGHLSQTRCCRERDLLEQITRKHRNNNKKTNDRREEDAEIGLSSQPLGFLTLHPIQAQAGVMWTS